jgi:putative ABC transport system permease protein
MSILKIVGAEIRYRLFTSICMVGIVAVAVASVVFFVRLSELASDRTRIIQRDMGLNLRILPADADLDAYWLKGYADGVIDESLLEKVLQQDVANRLVPLLQRTIPWGDGEAILTGIGDEQFARGAAMKPVFGGFGDGPNELRIGAVAAAKKGLSEGDQTVLLGRDFVVKRVLSSTGSMDDIRVYAPLATVQQLLDLPGKLNEIRALECECGEDVVDPEAFIRAALGPLLPGTQIVRQDRMAEARRKQRILAERIGVAATPVLILLSASGVAGLAFLNTHQRRGEIGLFAAVGMTAPTIATIIGTRAALLGTIGGVLGAWGGWMLVNRFGGHFVGFDVAGVDFRAAHLAIGGLAGGTIAFCGGLIPAVIAAKADIVHTLRGNG